MRSTTAFLLIGALSVAACGGPAATPGETQPGATQTGTASATPAGGGATSPPAATQPPAGGGTTVTVTLTGGPDAGTYDGSDNPNCSFGLIGTGGWGTQFSISGAANDQLSSLQLVAWEGDQVDPDGMFGDTVFLVTVVIGPLFETGSRTYEVKVVTEDSGDDSSGTGSAQVTDSGATAVIHVTGTTADGVGIDATVNCPSVTRA